MKAFIAQIGGSRTLNQTPEDDIVKAAAEKADDELLSELGLDTIVAATGEPQPGQTSKMTRFRILSHL